MLGDTDETAFVSVDDFGILADTSDSVCEDHNVVMFSGSWLVCRFLVRGCLRLSVLRRSVQGWMFGFYIGLTEPEAFFTMSLFPCPHFFFIDFCIAV